MLLLSLRSIGTVEANRSNASQLAPQLASSLSSSLAVTTSVPEQLDAVSTEAGLSLAQQVAASPGLGDAGVANVAGVASNLLAAAQGNLERHGGTREVGEQQGADISTLVETVALARARPALAPASHLLASHNRPNCHPHSAWPSPHTVHLDWPRAHRLACRNTWWARRPKASTRHSSRWR